MLSIAQLCSVHYSIKIYISFHFQYNTTKIQWVVAQKRLVLLKYTIWGKILSSRGPSTLSDHEKYKILKNHFKPGVNFNFLRKLLHACNRSCKTDYLTHEFVYSSSKDSVFCVYCTLFPDTQGKIRSSFMDEGYSQWHNIIEKENRHRTNSYHHKAIEQGMGLIQRFETLENTIPVQTDKTKDSRLRVYPVILKCIARAIHLLEKQGLPLRGHREDMIDAENDTDRNPGNFITFLHEIAQYCPELDNHLKNPLMKNATYISPKSQNEMIDVIGINTIQQHLINKVKDAKFHAVMADEVTSMSNEILSGCFRYVNGQKDIREVFLQFLDLERITGSHIGTVLLSFYKSSAIDIKQCRGQCYAGAPNMQSEKSGTASWILRESNKAITTHCCSHNLNLSLA